MSITTFQFFSYLFPLISFSLLSFSFSEYIFCKLYKVLKVNCYLSQLVSLVNWFPKSTGFTMTKTVILTMVTALQNNIYLKSESKLGSYSFRQWSRTKKEYLIRERIVYGDFTFKKNILTETFFNLNNILCFRYLPVH
jgi:hypothetical protein